MAKKSAADVPVAAGIQTAAKPIYKLQLKIPAAANITLADTAASKPVAHSQDD